MKKWLIALLAMLPSPIAAKDIAEGTITRFECGDNCYLTILDLDRTFTEITALCVAPQCKEWNRDAAMPSSFIGRKIRANIGHGHQLYGDGEIAGQADAFTKITFIGGPNSPMTPEEYFRRQNELADKAVKQTALIVSQPLDKTPDEYAKDAAEVAPANLPTTPIETNYKTFAQRMVEERDGLKTPNIVKSHDADVPLGAKIVAGVLFAAILAGLAFAWRARKAIIRPVANAVVMAGASVIIMLRKATSAGSRLRTAMIARADAHTGNDS